MLNGNDVQLFYKLLDSLSTSLCALSVKYEQLATSNTRQANDREKTDAAVIEMAQEVSSSFAAMTRDFEQLRNLASEGREHDIRFATIVQSMAKTMESLDAKLTVVTSTAEAVAATAKEGKSVTLHVDAHMDSFGNQLAAIQEASADVAKMRESVEEMKKQVEPFKRLAVLFSKPVAILIAIYVVFVTIIALIEGCDKVDKFRDKFSEPSKTSITNVTYRR